MRLLKKGKIGTAVHYAQERLVALGYDSGYIDGIFGPKTLQAVIQLQQAHRLTPDGVIGSQTWNVLTTDHRRPVGKDVHQEVRLEMLDRYTAHPNPNRKVKKVIKAALADLGATEKPVGMNSGPAIAHLVDGYNDYWHIDDNINRPWCAMAVSSWIRIGLGMTWDEHPFGFFGGVSQLVTWAEENLCWSLVPKPGAIFVMDRRGSSSDAAIAPGAGHCGLYVYGSKDGLMTVEGNVRNAVAVGARNEDDIVGYVHWWDSL